MLHPSDVVAWGYCHVGAFGHNQALWHGWAFSTSCVLQGLALGMHKAIYGSRTILYQS